MELNFLTQKDAVSNPVLFIYQTSDLMWCSCLWASVAQDAGDVYLPGTLWRWSEVQTERVHLVNEENCHRWGTGCAAWFTGTAVHESLQKNHSLPTPLCCPKLQTLLRNPAGEGEPNSICVSMEWRGLSPGNRMTTAGWKVCLPNWIQVSMQKVSEQKAQSLVENRNPECRHFRLMGEEAFNNEFWFEVLASYGTSRPMEQGHTGARVSLCQTM